MNPAASDIWTKLDSSNPAGDKLNAKQPFPDISNKILFAIDSEKKRHILIILTESEGGLDDRNSRGLTVLTRDLRIHDKEPERYLDIECRDSAGYAAFDIIGLEIAKELSKAHYPPAEIVRRILARWRRFWGQIPSEMLSREELFGLCAELWFLSHWLIPSIAPLEAIVRWRGPYGARHDFEWPGRSVEVKVSSSPRGRIHHIHGLEQLESPEGGNLFLYSLLIREERGGQYSLPLLISECRRLLDSDAEAMEEFEATLVRTGYSPAHDEEYGKIMFRIAGEALFTVDNNFPRLLPGSIAGGIPPGIERVEYEINLNNSEDLIVARSASEFTI